MRNEFPVIATERLVLREIRESDADAIFEIFGDDAVTRFYDLATFTDIEQARKMIARMGERNANGDALRWGIALQENDRVIGTGGFNQFTRVGTEPGSVPTRILTRAGIGYDLAQAFWNRGYMTEALRAIVRYGLETLNANRIEALVMLENDASVRVLEKIGFQREGILREYGFWKNQFWDLQMFALLKRAWSK